jgi:tetratricopeptide (TPR) repeat protein
MLLRAAYASENGGFRQEAEWLIRDVLQLAPDNVDALVKLALFEYEANRLPEAAVLFERALRIEERQPVLTMLGSVQRDLGDTDAAIRALRRSIEIDPEDDEALHVLGLALLFDAPFDAVEMFRRALAANPEAPYSLREMGRAYWKAGELGQAANACRLAIAKTPSDGWAHHYLGHVHWALRELPEAQQAMRSAARLEPENWLFWKDCAQLSASRGLIDDAEAEFSSAFGVEHDEAVLYMSYGLFLRDTQRLLSARGYLERALHIGLSPKRTAAVKEALAAMSL